MKNREENGLSGKKIIVMILIFVLLAATVAAGVIWSLNHYAIVDFQFYPRDAKELDLRGEAITLRQYQTLRRKLPGCEIHWNVPFQEGSYPEDTTELTVTRLSEEDLESLAYLPKLKTIHGQDCPDFELLARFRKERPEVDVEYTVPFSDGSSYRQDAREICLSSVAEEDVARIGYLPELQRIQVIGGGNLEKVDALRGNAHNLGLEFAVSIGGDTIADTQENVVVRNISEEELPLLSLLQSMKYLRLQDPQAPVELLLALRSNYPEVRISWDVEFAGQRFDDATVEVDLSQIQVTDLAEVEAGMAYLPQAQLLVLGLCGRDDEAWGNSGAQNIAVNDLENEAVAAFRDRVRDRYKVAWTVRVGPKIALRTDADNFMPGHFGIGRLFTEHAYNLRYCEDMVTLDIGHMTLKNIDFVAFMPKLKYLILAWTEVQSIEPIRGCKELIFLELDNSTVRDYSPLVDCTALQDLNIGNTFCKIDPILEMTWLRNLYMIKGSASGAYQATQTLLNTNVVTGGKTTVSGGWRKLQNYYDMRDNLGVPYMNG